MAGWTIWSLGDGRFGVQCDGGDVNWAGSYGGALYYVEEHCCCTGCGSAGPGSNVIPARLAPTLNLGKTDSLRIAPIIKSMGYKPVKNDKPNLIIALPENEISQLYRQGYTAFRVMKVSQDEFILQYGKVVGKRPNFHPSFPVTLKETYGFRCSDSNGNTVAEGTLEADSLEEAQELVAQGTAQASNIASCTVSPIS